MLKDRLLSNNMASAEELKVSTHKNFTAQVMVPSDLNYKIDFVFFI